VLIATCRCASPARRGAFVDERRIVMATKTGEYIIDERALPW